MKKNINVFFFGDSVTFGQKTSFEKSWVFLLSDFFSKNSKLRKRFNFNFTNSSRNGRTTRQALEDMSYEVQSQKIDILFIQFGLNDSNYWKSDKGLPRVSPLSFQANTLEIIQRAKKFGVKKIVILNNYLVKVRNKKYIKNTLYYNELLKKCYKSHKDVFYIDIYKYFIKKNIKNYLNSDGLHLNQKGNFYYYEAVKNKILKLIY